MPIKVLLLRYTHPDGSQKDWGYPVETHSASPAFTVFYGRAGSALRQAETPAAQCHDRNPAREAERREREKRAKGYYVLGEFWLADNRRALQRVTPSGVVPTSSAPPPSEPPAPPQWYWRWRPEPGMDAAAQQAQLEAARHQAAERLTWISIAFRWFEPEQVIMQMAGSIPLTVEHKFMIAFWLLLARACPLVRLADEQGQPVTAWPPQLPMDPAILETLDLKPQDLRQLLAATNGDDWFF
ncbi:MAG: hypothetical protein KDI55_22710 [Anaerolineae bacterium]|nr:hypothetical protein [Anaerolineae bacterium]